MLLYIGERGDMLCLQQISDKLQQAICLFSAPEDPEDIITITGTQYSHYIVDIDCYQGRQKELIRALKRFVGCIDGQLILLAVDMTTDHPMISELIYAGFTNIIFGHSENSTAVDPVDSQFFSVNKETGQYISEKQSSTLLLLEGVSATQPLTTELMEISNRETEAMKENMRETEWMAIAPYLRGEIDLVKKDEVECKKKGDGCSNYGFKIFSYGCCILTFFLFFTVSYQKLILKQPDTMYANKEQYLEGDAMVKATERPTESLPTPQVTQDAQVLEPAVTESTIPEPTATESTILEPVVTDAPIAEPLVTKPPVIASPLPENRVHGVCLDDNTSGEEERKSITVQSISLPSSIRMVTGKSINLEMSYSPSNAIDNRFSWKSSDSSVASVRNGRVKAKKPGRVRITVTSDNGRKAVCNITIASQ